MSDTNNLPRPPDVSPRFQVNDLIQNKFGLIGRIKALRYNMIQSETSSRITKMEVQMCWATTEDPMCLRTQVVNDDWIDALDVADFTAFTEQQVTLRSNMDPAPQFASPEEAEVWLKEQAAKYVKAGADATGEADWVNDVESFLNTDTPTSVIVDCSNCGCKDCRAIPKGVDGVPTHVATGPDCRCFQTGCRCLL